MEQKEQQEQKDTSLIEAAQKIKESIEKQLPFFEQNLASLQQSENIAQLPLIIHNICIAFEREAYKFLAPARAIYKEVTTDGMPESIQKVITDTSAMLDDLAAKENALQKEQLRQLHAEQAAAKAEGRVVQTAEEIRLFNHLEADLSSFYDKWIKLVFTGMCKVNGKQEKILKNLHAHCRYILSRRIEEKKRTLNKVNAILANENK